MRKENERGEFRISIREKQRLQRRNEKREMRENKIKVNGKVEG